MRTCIVGEYFPGSSYEYFYFKKFLFALTKVHSTEMELFDSHRCGGDYGKWTVRVFFHVPT